MSYAADSGEGKVEVVVKEEEQPSPSAPAPPPLTPAQRRKQEIQEKLREQQALLAEAERQEVAELEAATDASRKEFLLQQAEKTMVDDRVTHCTKYQAELGTKTGDLLATQHWVWRPSSMSRPLPVTGRKAFSLAVVEGEKRPLRMQDLRHLLMQDPGLPNSVKKLKLNLETAVPSSAAPASASAATSVETCVLPSMGTARAASFTYEDRDPDQEPDQSECQSLAAFLFHLKEQKKNKSDLILLRPLINHSRIKRLLDYGATRNFMSPSAVKKLHLGMKVVQLQQPLQVRIGDSTVLTIREKVKQTDAPITPCPPKIQQVVDQYANLMQEPFGLPNRPTKHHIELLPGAVRPKGRIYRMSPAELKELRRQLETLTSKGWIRPNTSESGAPVLFVPKRSGEFIMCIDYMALNKITRKSTEPLPRIDDLLDIVQGCTIFSKVDLKSGYHQIEMEEEDVHKTTFKNQICDEWQSYCKDYLHSHLDMTSGCHPEANGLAEVMNQVLFHLLRPVISPDQQDWVLHLARAQLMYNMSVHSSTGFSPYRLHKGREPRQPLDDIIDKAKPDLTRDTAKFARRYRLDVERARANLFKAQKTMIEQANRHRRPSPIRTGDHVWVASSELSREEDISSKLLPHVFNEEECEGQEGEDGGEEDGGGNEGDVDGEDNDVDNDRYVGDEEVEDNRFYQYERPRDVNETHACRGDDAYDVGDEADGQPATSHGVSQSHNQAKDGRDKHGSRGKKTRGEALISQMSQTKQARSDAVNEARGALTASQETRAPRKTGGGGGRTRSRGGDRDVGRKDSQRVRSHELRESGDEGEGVGPCMPEGVDDPV
ncbi:hypothetical protein CBR_g49174 [Chara braunii]|uniref:Reverse transcriptase domain-containing protein n=1 Tax=Chara braunii TaxID=69332 RepID=A0A388M4I0_CHABU|nr:hypothetical protein CBR_g49174 [Chara braunii]|eukprot:GBG89383.1 hypothetical protein CBR_g49174 [Chara braunii]